jgi:hypothetical protein
MGARMSEGEQQAGAKPGGFLLRLPCEVRQT